MTAKLIKVSACLILAAALMMVPATAAAGPNPGERVGEGSYNLTLHPENGEATTVSLTCTPNGGTHTGDQDVACAQLNHASGHIENIAAVSAVCTTQYSPVTASAVGTWDQGERIFYAHFGNACQANAATGGNVFNF